MKTSWLKRISTGFESWLLQTDPTVVPFVRIGFALILIVHILVWFPDAERWFTDDGILTLAEAHQMVDVPQWSLLDWLPNNLITIQACLLLLLCHSLMLLVGIASRWQAVAIFLWIVSFQHRNSLICDGEDTVCRLFAFFLIFLPLDRSWSLWNRWGFARNNVRRQHGR